VEIDEKLVEDVYWRARKRREEAAKQAEEDGHSLLKRAVEIRHQLLSWWYRRAIDELCPTWEGSQVEDLIRVVRARYRE
jgi:hypothetical protein